MQIWQTAKVELLKIEWFLSFKIVLGASGSGYGKAVVTSW